MSKKQKQANIIPRVFKLERIYLPFIIVCITALFFDGLSAYFELRDSNILLMNTFVSSLIISAHIFHVFNKLNKANVVSIIVYLLVLGTMACVPVRMESPEFEMGEFFIRTELMFFGLGLMISSLVDKKHLIYLSFANALFIAFYNLLRTDVLSPLEYMVYFSIVSGANWLVYLGNSKINKLALELEEANDKISKNNNELKELSKYKDNVVRVIGHDIRQPLTQISGLIEIYEDSKDETVIPLLKKAGEQALSMFDDVLLWNDSQSMNEIMQVNTIELKPIVSKISDALELALKTKNIKFSNDVNETFKMSADIRSLESILRNLCNNAIKFSNNNSTIFVNATQNDAFYIIEVKDQGIGIETEQQSKLFSVNNSSKGTKGEAGTGLGLIICKNLIEKQQGKLEIESIEGQGTSVFVYLPK